MRMLFNAKKTYFCRWGQVAATWISNGKQKIITTFCSKCCCNVLVFKIAIGGKKSANPKFTLTFKVKNCRMPGQNEAICFFRGENLYFSRCICKI